MRQKHLIVSLISIILLGLLVMLLSYKTALYETELYMIENPIGIQPSAIKK